MPLVTRDNNIKLSMLTLTCDCEWMCSASAQLRQRCLALLQRRHRKHLVAQVKRQCGGHGLQPLRLLHARV